MSIDLPEVGGNIELGRRGEEIAAAYLEQQGYRLVAANFNIPVGRNRVNAQVSAEIDLIAYEAATLCFVEVKTRGSDWFATPSANVDLRKQRQVTRAARAYRRAFGLTDAVYRYDVVSIVLASERADEVDVQIEILRNFWNEQKFRKRNWYARYWDD